MDDTKAPRIRNGIIKLMFHADDEQQSSSDDSSEGSEDDENATIDRIMSAEGSGAAPRGERKRATSRGGQNLQRLTQKQQALNHQHSLQGDSSVGKDSMRNGALASLSAETIGRYKKLSSMSWLNHYLSVVASEHSHMEKKLKEMEMKVNLMKTKMSLDEFKEIDQQVMRKYHDTQVNVDHFLTKIEKNSRHDSFSLSNMDEMKRLRTGLIIGAESTKHLSAFILEHNN